MISKIRLRIKNAIFNFMRRMRAIKWMHYPVVQVLCVAILTTIVMELFAKNSFIDPFIWIITHPIIFLINVMIVAIPFTLGIFTRRRYWVYCWISIFWIILAIVDCVVIHCRVTPFTFGDVRVLPDVLPVIDHYIPIWLLIVFIIIGLIVVIWVGLKIAKLPKIQGKFNYWLNILQAAIMAGACYGLVILSMNTGVIAVNFANIRQAYFDYGFSYCFANSVFNTGITKPKDYSKEKIDSIVDKIDGTVTPNVTIPADIEGDERHPNIIFVQLESFFDVNRLDGVEFAENPIPNITKLYKNYHTGLLHVPSISAGTANTEFEVLTGMNMNDFGPGEYPFKTVLNDMTTESIAYNLKNLGYSTHGIHNNTAGFYSRNVVYPNLGIDTFTSVEYMCGVERNQLNWAKDKIITKYVNKALDSTAGEDFVFAVSVQGHGAYPDDDVLENPSLLVSLDGLEGDVGKFNFAYYLEEISEMDSFVGDLIESLEKRNEKSIVVFYGDHLPGFDFKENDLNYGTLYDTEYVIWSNFDMGEKQVVDLEANELAAHVQLLLGFDEGIITKLHQKKANFSEEEYWQNLHDLSYDMLYGEQNCYGGVNPYVANPVKYAYEPVSITDVETIVDNEKKYYYMTIKGDNFTEYSTVYLNGEDKVETIYVSEHELFCPKLELKVGETFVIGQSKDNIEKLTHTDSFTLEDYMLHK